MTAVRFESHGHTYSVCFAYNPAVVQLLKDTVPGYARKWAPGRKEWEVDTKWVESLAAAFRSAGHTVVGIEQKSRNADTSQWARLLFTRVGPHRHAAVYRALSRCLHPDTPTGSTELQRELNDARSRIDPTTS